MTQAIDITPESALFGVQNESDPSHLSQRLNGLVAVFHSNERPLQGLSGWVDWRFRGAVSSYIKAGALSGKAGECAYLPLSFAHLEGPKNYHLILIGAGASDTPGQRKPLEDAALGALFQNIRRMKLERIGISKADLGNPSDAYFQKQLKGAPVWVIR